MNKRVAIFTAVLVSAVLLLSSVAMGATGAKDIKAFYRNIKIKVNGKLVDVGNTEPFIYNDSTYVPIRLISEALDKVVEWDNNQSTVIITDKSTSQTSQEIANKDAQIQNLTYQNSLLQSKIIELNKTIDDLKKEKEEKENADEYLEDYLYDEYSKWNDIKFNYKVKESSSGDLTLTIEFDKSDYKSEWNKLTERKIENWLNDIYDYVKDEFPKADFEGTIKDTDKKETLVSFEESGSKLKVKFYDSTVSFADLEDDLNYFYGSNLTKYSKNFGSLKATIEVEDYDDDEIYITVIVNTSKYGDEWDDVKDTAASDDWLYDIMEYAHGEYKDYIISGHVENSSGKTQATFSCTSSGRMKINWK
ncbi:MULTISPECIES: copper amine oxidase N-terminal domain-containing protein [Tepidanaerobacter]|uniref:copper amine oxidase N-terminal domain-containing protein n=1 Tax=Tepidanaerobacter TaxID=499228 RepID=UPI000AB066DD|nr:MULTISPECIES: copper amine oxidase N-terminal domain-containing protein [Tepidanaerobacter]HHV82174.1 copper amine oxidase N-terminal domain-containing protein [Tepidanaerobacter syntrophicus]